MGHAGRSLLFRLKVLSDIESEEVKNVPYYAQRATRLPPGHPEAYIEAFANIYANVTDTIRARILGQEPAELELDFPQMIDGARGLAFIESAVESSRSDQKWYPLKAFR